MKRLSEDMKWTVVETYDLGGGNRTSAYLPMAEHDRVMAVIQIGATWDTNDGLTTAKLVQATDAAGSGSKDLTTSGAGTGYNYNASNKVGVGGAGFVVLEARSTDLDHANGFTHVAVYYASTDNTGVDNVSGFMVVGEAQHSAKQLAGAALANVRAYVTPASAGGF
jgi:hypothetical protein